MSIAKGLLTKLDKMAWCVKERPLPERNACGRVNFCIHSEKLYDETVYSSVIDFSRQFNSLTGKRMTVCVTTPMSWLVRQPMEKIGLSDGLFAERVLEISRYADVGYHGHFYYGPERRFEQISHVNYDKETVTGQMAHEFKWFSNLGISPKVYIGGWWFLTADIVLELERAGVLVDASIRKGKRDAFGGYYLPDDKIPDSGNPFTLPPSGSVVEIQSIFGPVMSKQMMKANLAPYLNREKDRDLFFIFPLHDWDISVYRRNLLGNIEELNRYPHSVSWADVLDMRKEHIEKA